MPRNQSGFELSCFSELLQGFGWHEVHVIVSLVFAAHCPDEGVALGTKATVDRPGWVDHSGFVLHDNMLGLLWLTHEVEDTVLFRLEFDVKISFHAACVGVARHGVPGVTWFQDGVAHLQLAGVHL